MAVPRGAEAALFLMGALASDFAAMNAAREAVEREFGLPELESPVWPFTNTDYYRDELGPAPIRRFWVWGRGFDPGVLAERKLATNGLELRLAGELGGKYSRPVNLDPGYVTLAKIVLASAKNFAHRVYIGQGIYAEVTMRYASGEGFVALPWTFPDYASGRYEDFFGAAREKLRTSTT